MSLPDPLIPPGCSMAGNDWFPFYFDRLRKSKWWRRASDVARSRNVMMWGEAYKQTPAGSLPDDDDELAEAAGYGMDVEAFLSSKPEIMAPWVLCSDGRWYHPTVCEVVLDGWAKTSERRRKDAERKARQRDQVRGVTRDNGAVPRDTAEVTRDSNEVPPEIGTQTQQTGQDREEDADASLSSADDEKPEYPEAFEACWKAYPHLKGRSSKRKSFGYWRRIPAARRASLPAAIARYARDGREPREDCGAPAMDRWLRDERYLDWLNEAAPPEASSWSGPADVRAAVQARIERPEYAETYLRQCSWREIPSRALVTDSPTMLAKLKPAEPALKAIGWALVLEQARTA